MTTPNPREELVSLLRGFFSCPIISSLGKRGILTAMLDKPFNADSFPDIIDKDLFLSILKYFTSLGLIYKNEYEMYTATDLGKKIFKRYGSFNLLHSYGSFLSRLDSMLFEPFNEEKPKCDRLENVIGSGQTNGRKFFPKALKMIENMDIGLIADIGCGDGNFLSKVVELFPSVNVIASDISKTSVSFALANLKKNFPGNKFESVLSDAMNINCWAKFVAERANKAKGKTLISMWYLIHEISRGNDEVVINFFKNIYKKCPQAEIIIGEIVAIPASILAANRYDSIMPEFLFFHEISGQGVLAWIQYQNILKNIPYKLINEELFDLVKDGDKNIPTGFIWQLQPK